MKTKHCIAKLFLIPCLFLFFACDRTEEEEKPEDSKQFTTAISKSTILPGPVCTFGGVEIHTGIDSNGNGVLDDSEITNSEVVCETRASLVLVTEETAGDNCGMGGQKIESGIDDDLNGVLDSSEVDTTTYVCNGQSDLSTSLVSISTEPPGTKCTYGGKKIETGFDTDNDNILDANEVIDTSYLCEENTKPVAISISLVINKNSAIGITLTGFDPDNDTITYSNTTPSNGTLSGTAPSLIYTPNTDYTGSDSFSFLVNDGSLDSNTGVVNLTVVEVTGLDKEPPQILTTYPEDGVINTPVDSAITVVFNEGMNGETITTGTFVVNDGNTNISGSVSYNETNQTATFTPVENLQYLTPYSVEIARTVTDKVGNEMTMNHTFSFTTQEATTTIAPAAEATYPADGDLSININNNITVIFNKTIDDSTLTSSTFTVFDGGTPVSGTISYQNMIAVFDPSADLDYNKTYSVTLTTGIKDLDTEPLAGNVTWSFTTRPAPLSEVASSLSLGSEFSCAIINNQAKCWGYNNYGQLGQGDKLARGDHSFEMGDDLPIVDLGSSAQPVSIAVGYNHACALLDDDTVKCWGSNTYGELGQGDNLHRGDNSGEMGVNLPAIDLGSGPTVVQLSAGINFNCARLSDGSIKCWGYNGYGQLGIGHTSNIGISASHLGENLQTVDLGAGNTATQVISGGYHTCAILSDGDLVCWGYNGYGQLGVGDTLSRGDGPGEMGESLVRVNLGTGRLAVDVVAGYYHTCAILDNGATKCWGYNGSGELGLGHTVSRGSSPADMGDNLPPVSLGTNRSALSLSLAGYHTCAKLDDLSLKCWGANNAGQLGIGTASNVGGTNGQMGDLLAVTELGTTRTVAEIATGYNHTCALLDDGSIKCFGNNSNGQLGLGHTTARGDGSFEMGDLLKTITPPVRTPSNLVTDISIGNDFGCAVVDAKVRCWGKNNYGQLGIGDKQSRGDHAFEMGTYLPEVDLGTSASPVSVKTGESHACALLDNGTIKCWGYNAFGQLGLGDTSSRGDATGEMGDNLPVVDIGSGRTITELSLGFGSTCALLDNNTVKCWGYNGYGQLGAGNTNNVGDQAGEMGDSLATIDLGTGKTATSIVTSGVHSCAILSDNTIKCWGYNGFGQLGLGDTASRGDTGSEMGDALPIVNLGSGRTALEISLGYYHTCARLDNGSVKCWGYNANGQLGLGHPTSVGGAGGDMGDSLPIISLGTDRTALQIATLAYHTCAKLDDFTLKCWGANSSGNLGKENTINLGDGSGEMGDALTAIDLGTGRSVVKASTGYNHTCAILDNSHLKCWGKNDYGQLGLEHIANRGDGNSEMGDRLLPLEF